MYLIYLRHFVYIQIIQLGNGQQIVIPAGQVIQGQTIQIQGSQSGQMQQVVYMTKSFAAANGKLHCDMTRWLRNPKSQLHG